MECVCVCVCVCDSGDTAARIIKYECIIILATDQLNAQILV